MRKINCCDGIYSNSLDVRFTKECPNKCSFCIEKNGVAGRKRNLSKMIDNTIKTKKDNVLILGGEPLLGLNSLFTYINGIRSYIKSIYITTSLPKNIDPTDEVFIKIFDLIDGLNVSFHHYNKVINNSIFGEIDPANSYDRLDLLRDIVNNSSLKNVKKIRVSINLSKDGINTKYDLDKMLNKLVKLGITNIKINELQLATDQYISYEEITGTEMASSYFHGCQSDISKYYTSYTTLGVTITLKRSCFLCEESRTATILDLYKAFRNRLNPPTNTYNVMYEDGSIEKGWLQK